MKIHCHLACLLLTLFAGATSASAQTAISPAAGPTTAVNAALPEGFIMINGKVHMVQKGRAVPLNQELTLRVTPTGITGFDQTPRTLSNDTMLTMDGRVVPIPEGLVIAPPPPRISDEAARNLDAGVSGENLSGLAPGRSAPPPTRVTTTVTTQAPAPARGTPTTSVTEVVTGQSPAAAAVPAPAASAPAASPGRTSATPAGTVFDPNAVNDGTIEAAGTGTRRPTQ
ncbi:MAG TPA: hypothetical protein VD994_07820 [Prosthecobacter sp.]|nr:hypothetical protein [Prosthecobacter sp.]